MEKEDEQGCVHGQVRYCTAQESRWQTYNTNGIISLLGRCACDFAMFASNSDNRRPFF